MIVDHLDHAGFYHRLGSRFVTAFDYLSSTDFAKVAPGKVLVDGEDVFAMVQTYESRLRNAATTWEAHRRYIDIQYIVAGSEQMGYGRLDALEVTQPYHEGNDVVLFKEKPEHAYDFVRVSAGMFTIFAPHDAHLPGVALDQAAAVSKVVMKIRV